MNAVLLVVMALASFRLWRFIAEDKVPGYPIQVWASKRPAVGNFVMCPWCLGAWLSAAVVAVTDALVGIPMPVMQWLAVSALVGLIASNLDG